jgi:hypothetical protein
MARRPLSFRRDVPRRGRLCRRDVPRRGRLRRRDVPDADGFAAAGRPTRVGGYLDAVHPLLF